MADIASGEVEDRAPTPNYRIEGPAFIYSDRQTRRVSTILGYPMHLLAPPS
jgi:hypothetical protein